MGSTYWYYPQQIYAAKLIQNEQKKYEFSKQKKSSRFRPFAKYIKHGVNI